MTKIYTGLFSKKALKGYDAVSYFGEDAKPQKGSKKYTYSWNNVDWYFASQENLEAFKENPEKYAPQYGGHCAWAASQSMLAKGNPDNWDIIDGKLYLNINDRIQTRWQSDKENFIKDADKLFPALAK